MSDFRIPVLSLMSVSVDVSGDDSDVNGRPIFGYGLDSDAGTDRVVMGVTFSILMRTLSVARVQGHTQ